MKFGSQAVLFFLRKGTVLTEFIDNVRALYCYVIRLFLKLLLSSSLCLLMMDMWIVLYIPDVMSDPVQKIHHCQYLTVTLKDFNSMSSQKVS